MPKAAPSGQEERESFVWNVGKGWVLSGGYGFQLVCLSNANHSSLQLPEGFCDLDSEGHAGCDENLQGATFSVVMHRMGATQT